MYSYNATKSLADEQFLEFHITNMEKRTEGMQIHCVKCKYSVTPDEMVYFFGGPYHWVCLNKLYFSTRRTALRHEIEGKPEIEDYKNYIERVLYVMGRPLEEFIISQRKQKNKRTNS